MKLSPLQLESYFLTDLNCRANQDYRADKETKFQETDLLVVPDVHPIKERPQRWQVSLNIKLQPSSEANSPYYFSMNLVGVIWVAPELPQEKLEALVRTNGPSMLYGAAREMARDLMGRGPFLPLLLPSVSFIPDATALQTSKTPETQREAEVEAKAK